MNRNEPDSTSLDLLLDTITNTFGGVLFVTILVVLQLRTGQMINEVRSANEPAAHSINALHEELSRKKDEVDLLKQVAGAQRRAISQLSMGDAQESLRQVIEFRARLQELDAERVRSLAAIEQEARKAEQLDSQLADRRSRIELEKQRQEQLEQDITREKLVRTRTAELPTLRETAKREFPVIVKFGRLYAPYSLDPVSLERTRHLEEFVLIGKENEITRLTPNPLQGIPLDSSESAEDMLGRLWDQFPKEAFYVCGAVWDDSFSEFPALKKALVERGIEYRLIPTKEGDMVQEGNVGGAFVQ